jgi:hypothetical protein
VPATDERGLDREGVRMVISCDPQDASARSAIRLRRR